MTKKNLMSFFAHFFFIAVRQQSAPQTPSATIGRIPDEGDWGFVVG